MFNFKKTTKMTRGKKIFIGVLAFLPLIATTISLIYLFTSFLPEMFALEAEYDKSIPSEVLLPRIIGYAILVILMMLLILVLMIYFIIHAINNKRVKNEERIIWILLFVLMHSIAFPIYWGIRIWPEEKPESNFVKM